MCRVSASRIVDERWSAGFKSEPDFIHTMKSDPLCDKCYNNMLLKASDGSGGVFT